jgi:ribosomal protein S18 acetylase RimI-like enzyme
VPAIRPYRPSDLDALYEICLRTGAAGEDATTMVDDARLFGELFAAPYGVLEPEHAFVLDDGTGRAVAYVLGALDTRAFEERCEAAWWPALRDRYPIGVGRRRLDELLVSLLHAPPRAAGQVVDDYPSHLHIDLLPEAQGSGWGRRMTDTLLDALGAAGSVGVHLGVSTANDRALGFYEHLGFVELARDATTHTLGRRLR